MPFKHKLSKRLALSRGPVLIVFALVLACESIPRVSGPPNPSDPVSLFILPQQITVLVRDSVDFRAYSVTASGDTIVAQVA